MAIEHAISISIWGRGYRFAADRAGLPIPGPPNHGRRVAEASSSDRFAERFSPETGVVGNDFYLR